MTLYDKIFHPNFPPKLAENVSFWTLKKFSEEEISDFSAQGLVIPKIIVYTFIKFRNCADFEIA